jgi:hypothetical protein
VKTAATKEALQSRLAALQQEHHVLEERHGEAKKAHAMAIKRGGLGGELNDWTNNEVDEAKKKGRSWVAKEVVDFMKYEKNNPYFDKVGSLAPLINLGAACNFYDALFGRPL